MSFLLYILGNMLRDTSLEGIVLIVTIVTRLSSDILRSSNKNHISRLRDVQCNLPRSSRSSSIRWVSAAVAPACTQATGTSHS